MPQGYICQYCGHASGYHIDEVDKFGKCRVVECNCEEFIWSDENYKSYLRRNKRKEESA